MFRTLASARPFGPCTAIRNRRLLTPAVLFFGLIGLPDSPAASPAAQGAVCLEDPTTGLAIPFPGRGACMQNRGSFRLLTQTATGGLLVAWTDDGAWDESGKFRQSGREISLLYCSATLLDPVTGSPGQECLSTPDVPGPGAFLGVGELQASAVFNLDGSAACPSSVHIQGIVHSPGGEAFRVRSSFLSFGTTATGDDCRMGEERILVEHLGPASDERVGGLSGLSSERGELPIFPQLDGGRLTVLEKVLSLDDSEFELLVRIAGMQPSDRQLLGRYLASSGSVQISASGRVQPPGHPAEDPVTAPVMFALGDNIRDVWDLLTEIQTRRGLRNIKEVVNELDADILALLNRRPALVSPQLLSHSQTIVATVQDMDAESVAEFARLVGDTFGSSANFLVALRADFQNFRGNSCAAGSVCAGFKNDVKAFLDTSNGNLDLLLELRDLLPASIPVDLARLDTAWVGDFLSSAPPFALFTLYRLLEGLVPGWREIPETIRAQIPQLSVPASGGSGLRPAAADSLVGMAAAAPADIVCVSALSEPNFRLKLSGLRLYLRISEALATYANDAICPMDFTLGATGVAVVGGGGGAGAALTVAAHPCRTGAVTVAKVIHTLGEIVTAVLNYYDRCEEADFRLVELEKSLSECRPLIAFQLPRFPNFVVGGYLTDLIDLVELRQWQMERVGLSTADKISGLDAARRDLEAGNYHSAYQFVCGTYQNLQKNIEQAIPGSKGRRP